MHPGLPAQVPNRLPKTPAALVPERLAHEREMTTQSTRRLTYWPAPALGNENSGGSFGRATTVGNSARTSTGISVGSARAHGRVMPITDLRVLSPTPTDDPERRSDLSSVEPATRPARHRRRLRPLTDVVTTPPAPRSGVRRTGR